ncbi:prepilin-type N-terminal cleavage/methylation domain-containing protein [Brachybacterium paraconglomeratum]|uniref:prepilin-type N-terminal cleavage/methylation domain-containing protein n=1 Tax=Brachybacterium paraconglomeratum TaxID=173362 RepID=UPI0022AFB1AB|nr:prepilin-type N-terminal cleavage/methylation domain-containing protein [Brachybacterium paraconglomeratum]MCZ4328126.1 prepilin-type N-terminal cleavage/methylation domain-containing protein [Brachybacterium paraconglomeratum]
MLCSSRRVRRRAPGFTIAELLVVVVVIAILAAISIVAYIGIQSRANDSAVLTDLRNAGQLACVYELTEGDLPNAPAHMQGEYRLQFAGESYSDASWCRAPDRLVIAASSTSGKAFAWKSSSGSVEAVDGDAGACATFGITWDMPSPRHLRALKNGDTGVWSEYVDH